MPLERAALGEAPLLCQVQGVCHAFVARFRRLTGACTYAGETSNIAGETTNISG
jgi:hypothetical protein